MILLFSLTLGKSKAKMAVRITRTNILVLGSSIRYRLIPTIEGREMSQMLWMVKNFPTLFFSV
jgi:hypothetical protein